MSKKRQITVQGRAVSVVAGAEDDYISLTDIARHKNAEHTDGRETISGRGLHIREGVVVRPCAERRHEALGRVQLKSVSERYLLRKGGTEYN